MSANKDCFVICPIGSEGTDTRERSNKLMRHIIQPALDDYGYSPIRADDISEPGMISTQVIEKAVESELVIADLTDHNPNVFYELAVRHASAKPYIQLIDSSQNIPFDISDIRTIEYDFDVSRADKAIEEIQAQLETIESEDPIFDNPISRAADFKSWRESEDPIQQNLADILNSINRLSKKIDDIDSNVVDANHRTLEAETGYVVFDPETNEFKHRQSNDVSLGTFDAEDVFETSDIKWPEKEDID